MCSSTRDHFWQYLRLLIPIIKLEDFVLSVNQAGRGSGFQWNSCSSKPRKMRIIDHSRRLQAISCCKSISGLEQEEWNQGRADRCEARSVLTCTVGSQFAASSSFSTFHQSFYFSYSPCNQWRGLSKTMTVLAACANSEQPCMSGWWEIEGWLWEYCSTRCHLATKTRQGFLNPKRAERLVEVRVLR